jgi:hypothetical protein
MNILYKNGSSIGMRYPHSFIGVLLRLILLALFFVVTYQFTIGKVNTDNWMTCLLFIFGLLLFGVNKRMAVYDRKTHQLTLYKEFLALKGVKYHLPSSRDQLLLLTEQRTDYYTSNFKKKALLFVDIWLKLPDQSIALDTVTVNDSLQKESLTNWHLFFDAVYDPQKSEKITGGYAFYYWEVALWIVIFISGVAAFYLRHLNLLTEA